MIDHLVTASAVGSQERVRARFETAVKREKARVGEGREGSRGASPRGSWPSINGLRGGRCGGRRCRRCWRVAGFATLSHLPKQTCVGLTRRTTPAVRMEHAELEVEMEGSEDTAADAAAPSAQQPDAAGGTEQPSPADSADVAQEAAAAAPVPAEELVKAAKAERAERLAAASPEPSPEPQPQPERVADAAEDAAKAKAARKVELAEQLISSSSGDTAAAKSSALEAQLAAIRSGEAGALAAAKQSRPAPEPQLSHAPPLSHHLSRRSLICDVSPEPQPGSQVHVRGVGGAYESPSVLVTVFEGLGVGAVDAEYPPAVRYRIDKLTGENTLKT